jgi:hypothetical protein
MQFLLPDPAVMPGMACGTRIEIISMRLHVSLLKKVIVKCYSDEPRTRHLVPEPRNWAHVVLAGNRAGQLM